MKTPSSHLGDLNIDTDAAMTPMIDVVFLLLVFFVWTASFQIVEQILPSQLSAQTGSAETLEPIDLPPPKDFDDIVIRIGWSNNAPTYRLNQTTVNSLQEIQERLTLISGIDTGAPVILHPDPVVPLGYVIAVYDVAKLSGFDKVSFAVNPNKLLE